MASYTAALEEMSLLEVVLRRPAIQSVAGQQVVRRAKQDLIFYFRQLGRVVELLGLETMSSSFPDNQQAAQQIASLNLAPVLERLGPLLHGLLAQNLQSAFKFGVDQADDLIKRFLMEAIGDIPVPPVVGERPGPGDPQAAAYAEETAARLVTGINEETQRRLAALVGRGIRDKLGVPGLGRAIRHELLQMTRHRSELIATTEMNNAMSESSLQQFIARGRQFKTTVVAADPCPICIGNHAQGPIRLNNSFQSGHQHPAFHPRCRCALVPARAPES